VKRVAVLVPAYQAAPYLAGVLERLLRLVSAGDVLVVDDGSTDGTGEVARATGVRVSTSPHNRGKGHALLSGFELLRGADGVLTMDADGQHPPECLPGFVAAFEDGADLVLGARRFEGRMPPHRRFANALSSGWASALAGQRIADSQCGYRLYSRAVLERTPVTPGGYEFESEVVVRAARMGFRLGEVAIPTVYGGEKSQIRLTRDVPRIVGTLVRLSFEGTPVARRPRPGGVEGRLPR
jgi:glycosyltransferase involved in cell wall biosynthesis